MAMFIITLDEPLHSGEAQWEAYGKKRDAWVSTVLQTPGLKEVRFYVDPYEASPIVTGCYEFDSLESIYNMLGSDGFKATMAEMRQFGVTNIQWRILDNSPLMPEPLKP